MKGETLRVAMIIHAYSPYIGGAEQQLAALAPLLKGKGIDVHVLTRRRPGLKHTELIQNVPVHRLAAYGPKPVASLFFTFHALSLLRRMRPDVIHAHGILSPTTAAVIAKRLFGPPVVVKILLGGGRKGELTRLMQKPLGKTRLVIFRKDVDAFISISGEIDQELAQMGISPENRYYIPNGVDITRFRPATPEERQAQRRRLDLPAEAPIAIFAGRLERQKCVDHLMAVWPAVRAKIPNALLLIAGTGSQEKALQSLAGEGIHFLGSVKDTVAYLQSADLFVLPSAAEGLSNALLEALACGLPAVATRVGGNPEVVIPDKTGLLVPPGDLPALQEALLSLLSDPVQCAYLGQQGREYVVHNYDLKLTVEKLFALYQTIQRKGKRP